VFNLELIVVSSKEGIEGMLIEVMVDLGDEHGDDKTGLCNKDRVGINNRLRG